MGSCFISLVWRVDGCGTVFFISLVVHVYRFFWVLGVVLLPLETGAGVFGTCGTETVSWFLGRHNSTVLVINSIQFFGRCLTLWLLELLIKLEVVGSTTNLGTATQDLRLCETRRTSVNMAEATSILGMLLLGHWTIYHLVLSCIGLQLLLLMLLLFLLLGFKLNHWWFSLLTTSFEALVLSSWGHIITHRSLIVDYGLALLFKWVNVHYMGSTRPE